MATIVKNQIIIYSQLGINFQEVVFKVTKTKNIRILIKSNLEITVSFPKSCSLKKAKQFFESKIIWVKNSLQRIAKRQEIYQKIQNSYNKLDITKIGAREFLAKSHYLILRCKQLAELHNFSLKKIILRRQKTIWGSCSAENNISLNGNLVFLSDDLIDYVILHELTHTQVKNHSKKFWDKLELILPNCKKYDKQLRMFSPSMPFPDFKGF